MNQLQTEECAISSQICVVLCNKCVLSALKEPEVLNLLKCIELCIECASICSIAPKVMHLNSKICDELRQLCADIAYRCSVECRKFEYLEDCIRCAIACESFAENCVQLSVEELLEHQ